MIEVVSYDPAWPAGFAHERQVLEPWLAPWLVADIEHVGSTAVHAYKADAMHWFCKPSAAHRTHHLHVVPRNSTLWRDNLVFRDALRSDPELAANYGRLKLELAQRFRHDREAYTDAKSSFIRSAIHHNSPEKNSVKL